MAEETIAVTAVHRSLIRPDRDHLAGLGVERAPAIMLGTAAFILGWVLMSPVTVVIAVLLLAIGCPALRQMAKRDPVFTRILQRRLMQQHHYAAHAHTVGALRPTMPQQREGIR